MSKGSSVVHERHAKMASISGKKTVETERMARFLNPPADSKNVASQIPCVPLLSERIAHKLVKWPEKVLFNGWRSPQRKWKLWVDKLAPVYGHIWKKAGIYDAIMASTFEVRRDESVVRGLIECFCSESNTFIFTWGEASLTLEDMYVLGGLSILGEPVRIKRLPRELEEIEEKLMMEKKRFLSLKAQKAVHSEWLNQFMDSESDLVHEALLVLWLSRYVFPSYPSEIVEPRVFQIAVRLAQGTRLALAPAVLASIYRDLRVLVSPKDNQVVWAPFQIMQMWAWEHFVSFRPINGPNPLCYNEPRVARWHKLKSNLKLPFVKSLLRSPTNFKWRPYTAAVDNWSHPSFYRSRGEWVSYKLIEGDRDLRSFAHCLMACDLVGLDSTEVYLPHRIARQLGFDQDLPGGHVHQANATREVAWEIYEKSFKGVNLYLPAQHIEPHATVRYIEWWNHSTSARKGKIKELLLQEKRKKLVRTHNNPKKEKKEDGKNKRKKRKLVEEGEDDDHLTLLQKLEQRKGHNGAKNRGCQIKQGTEVLQEVKRVGGGASADDPIEVEDDKGLGENRSGRKVEALIDNHIELLKRDIAGLQAKVVKLKDSCC